MRRKCFIALSLLPLVLSFSVVDRQHEAPQHVHHQISLDKALQEAKNMKVYEVPPAGCKQCTYEEMTYCQNQSVIEDHCCCDNSPLGGINGFDVLNFVEHTCYYRQEGCKEIRAGNCGEYMRLRECCCHSYLASVWKYKAGGAHTRASYFLLSFASFCTVIFIKLIFK